MLQPLSFSFFLFSFFAPALSLLFITDNVLCGASESLLLPLFFRCCAFFYLFESIFLGKTWKQMCCWMACYSWFDTHCSHTIYSYSFYFRIESHRTQHTKEETYFSFFPFFSSKAKTKIKQLKKTMEMWIDRKIRLISEHTVSLAATMLGLLQCHKYYIFSPPVCFSPCCRLILFCNRCWIWHSKSPQ